MAHVDGSPLIQAGSLQGSQGVSSGILAANNPGTGSGWQQSKQNWVLPAVVGYSARMTSSCLCCVEAVPLDPASCSLKTLKLLLLSSPLLCFALFCSALLCLSVSLSLCLSVQKKVQPTFLHFFFQWALACKSRGMECSRS